MSHHPVIAAQLHPTKNGSLTSDQVAKCSGMKLWWFDADCQHSWEETVSNRVRFKTGCPFCKKTGISGQEKRLFKFFDDNFDNVKENVRGVIDSRLEVDIWLPDLNVAIEFNGEYWHSEYVSPSKEAVRDKHIRKEKLCLSKGIKLLVVWEKDFVDDELGISAELFSIINNDSNVPERFSYNARRKLVDKVYF